MENNPPAITHNWNDITPNRRLRGLPYKTFEQHFDATERARREAEAVRQQVQRARAGKMEE